MFFLCLAPVTGFAQEMDALEGAYKDQHDNYTAEIKELQVYIARRSESLDKERAIIDQLHQLDLQDGSYRNPRNPTTVLARGLLDSANLLQKKIDRKKELSEKKSELKIKVLEKKGTLPGWWTK